MGTDTQKMTKFSAALLVLIAAVAVVASASNVVVLTPDNFDAVVDGSKNVFVEFYAPWCGHCKRLTPEYEIVGDAFARTPEVVVAKVDADAHRSLGSRFGVTGFPTLKFFSKGSTEPTDYSGGRTAEDLVTYINDNSGTRAAIKKAPEAVVALTPSDFDEVVMDESKFALVEFYAPWCGHCKNLAPVYEKVAAAFANEEHCVVAKVDADKHKDLGGRYGVSGFPTILYFPEDDKSGEKKYQGARDEQALVDFLNEQCGTARNADGSLNENAGRIDDLDILAANFLAADEAARAAALADAEAFLAAYDGPEGKAAKLYVVSMKRIADRGDTYVADETLRLQRMIESGSVKATKVDEFTKRVNVLAAFKN